MLARLLYQLLLLCCVLMLIACERKVKIKLSAWQTCEQITKGLIENQLTEDQKLFYLNPTLVQELEQKYPHWQASKKQGKGTFSIEYLSIDEYQNQLSQSNQAQLPKVFSTAPCVCRYLYLVHQVPLLLDLKMVQHESNDWKIDQLIHMEEQEQLIQLLGDQGLAQTETSQKGELGLYGIDQHFKPQSTLVITQLDGLLLIDGEAIKLPNDQWEAQIPLLMVKIEKAFAWREKLAKQAQAKYQRKIAFALSQNQPFSILKSLFKLSFLSKSEGISLIVKNKHQHLTMLALATPELADREKKDDFYVVHQSNIAIVKRMDDQKLSFEYQLQGKAQKAELPLQNGKIETEALIVFLEQLKAKIANRSTASYGLLIALNAKDHLQVLISLLDQIKRIDENIKISIDLRDAT